MVGDPCKQDSDCSAISAGARCLGEKEGFASGYCSTQCTAGTCGEGQSCAALFEGLPPLCLSSCQHASDCHDGAQCYQDVCQPRCERDAECRSEGHVCQDGSCVERPGKKPGESCTQDGECQYRACVSKRCALACQREAACSDNQTCALDRDASFVRGSCIDRRKAAGGQPLASCTDDAQCKQGACVMGVCLLMCQRDDDCKAAADSGGTACVELPAPLRKLSVAKWPAMKGCLPKNQPLVASYKATDTLLVPATGRSVVMVVNAPDIDDSIEVGMQWINDFRGNGVFIIASPSDIEGYFKSPLRHQPGLGSATLLLSGAPQRVILAAKPYPFQAFGVDGGGINVEPTVTAVYQLADQAPKALAQARLPLRIHITDVSGLPSACSFRNLKASNAATVLKPMVDKLQEIWGQSTTGVTFDPISFVDSDASSSIDATSDTGLGQTLKAVSRNSGGGADLVLVRSISPNGVLGIAGGIPSAPGLKNNPRTGAVFALNLLCIAAANYGLTELAQTAAHELGHSFGLSHAVERDGHGDPLGDGSSPSESTRQGQGNLMYWAATDPPGEQLTAEQGEVIRSMPQVRP